MSLVTSRAGVIEAASFRVIMEKMQSEKPAFHDPASSCGASFKDVVYASLVLCGFLFLAVSGHYLSGRLLFPEVVWDPVGIYTFYPGDKVLIDAFQSGFFPLWDATRGFGAPHVSPSFGIGDFPLKIIPYLFDSTAGWEIYILLRFFCAGLFCFFLARELPLGFPGSVFAAISYMLCGYFREFHNLPGINVVLWFPLVMLCFTRFARRRSMFYFAAVVFTGSFMDNNPESTFFAMAYISVYYILIEYNQPRNKHNPVRRILEPVFLVLAMDLCGVLMDLESVLPFMEYFGRSWNFHPPELGQLHIPVHSAVGLVTPVFDYWMSSTPNLSLENLEQLTLIPAYIGGVTFVLAILALLRQKRIPAPGLFYAGAALLFAGMIFGVPPFNLLYHLPFIRGFQNFRYTQPYLAHAAAMLGGIGLEMLLVNPRARKQALVIAALIVAWFASHVFIFREHVLASNTVLAGMAGAAAAAVIIMGAAVILWKKYPARKTHILAVAVIIAAGLELVFYFNLVRPLFGPAAFNLAEPRAARYMENREAGPFRIWGLDQRIIHPNLAGLYGLSDIRDQSPVYVRDYVLFLSRVNHWYTHGEMMQGFLENGKFYFDLEWENTTDGLLDLLNVRYVLSYGRPGTRSFLDAATRTAIIAPASNYVVPAEITVNGSFRQAVISHSPSRIELSLDADTLRGDASAQAAIMEKSIECPLHDGVFMAAWKADGNRSGLIFARHLDPKRDKGWVPFNWRESGHGSLMLAALPGPQDSSKCDYALWSVPRVLPPNSPGLSEHGLNEVYDREFRVYENGDAMARVFSVTQLARGKGLESTVRRLVRKDPAVTAWVRSISSPPRRLSEAQVSAIEEGPGRLSFQVRCPDRCFAVVSNLYYPGWRARSDNEEKRVYRTDGVLQGVFLDADDEKIELTFEPISFGIGWWFHAMLGVFFALMLAVAYLRRR